MRTGASKSESKLATGACARRSPRPTLGRSRPKGPCHWLSLLGRRAVAGRLEAPFLTGGGLNPLQTSTLSAVCAALNHHPHSPPLSLPQIFTIYFSNCYLSLLLCFNLVRTILLGLLVFFDCNYRNYFFLPAFSSSKFWLASFDLVI